MLLAAVLSVAAIIVIDIRKEPEKALLKIMSDRVDLQVRNVHYTEVGDSGMKWEIRADTARYQKKENLAFFDKLTVKLVMKDGKTFVMTGDQGRLNTESRDMEIEGNVGIVSENGDRFKTDRLRYRNADKVIETDRPVVMENEASGSAAWEWLFPWRGKRSPSCRRSGHSWRKGCGEKRVMPARMLTIIVCLGVLIAALWQSSAVSGESKQKPKVERDQPIQIVSDRLDAYSEKRMVVFSGNAVATQGARTIRSDRLTLYYKEDKKPARTIDRGSGGNGQRGKG